MIRPRTVSITWTEGSTVTGRLVSGGDGTLPGVLLAHGAGTDQDHTTVASLRDSLAAAGLDVLSFNYPYAEAGRRRPDPPGRLLDCHRSVAAWFRTEVSEQAVMAGRSMGGRMATLLASDGEPAVGVVAYAYPLHPAGKPDRLRIEHLARIVVPMLFIVGTRDPLARLDLVEQHLVPLPEAVVEVIDEADHSFRVPKRSGRTAEEIVALVAAMTASWLATVPPRP